MKKRLLLLLLIYTLCGSHTFMARKNFLFSEQEYTDLLHEADQDLVYKQMTTQEDIDELYRSNPKKPVTFVIFIAADNDLHYFAWKNIKQMEAVGSNENINIIVQLNTPGYFNPTKRYIIKQGRRVLVQADGFTPNQKLNSGSPYTLIDCVEWALKHYPAEQFYLCLWDHGTGPHDPGIPKTINTSDLFYMNPVNQMLELDRSIGFLDMIAQQALQDEKQRGICFDETFKSYMTNQDLKFALSEIHHRVLKGKKIDVLAFDACLMSMIEIANICKDHVHYMVGSQEVEFGTGYDYELLLRPFKEKALTPYDFAVHTVEAFRQMYINITPDFTHAAIDLSKTNQLEKNIHLVSLLLDEALSNQVDKNVTHILEHAKSPQKCTCFDEPTYIDLSHFYQNILDSIHEIKLHTSTLTKKITSDLKNQLEEGLKLIKQNVIANACGSNLQQACGLSIYFPQTSIFYSYPKCDFAITNHWSLMITKYLLSKH